MQPLLSHLLSSSFLRHKESMDRIDAERDEIRADNEALAEKGGVKFLIFSVFAHLFFFWWNYFCVLPSDRHWDILRQVYHPIDDLRVTYDYPKCKCKTWYFLGEIDFERRRAEQRCMCGYGGSDSMLKGQSIKLSLQCIPNLLLISCLCLFFCPFFNSYLPFCQFLALYGDFLQFW